jgi:hypothetical protein
MQKVKFYMKFDSFFHGLWGGGALMTAFSIFNIVKSKNLELKLYIVLKSWTEKLHFSN